MSKYKMAIIVRTDLGMGKGKMVAQGCHAAVLATYNLLKTYYEASEHERTENESLKAFHLWLTDIPAQTKIVLRADSEAQLLRLGIVAAELGIPSITVHDAGKTQLEPGTITVLGIGPCPSEKIDLVTESLKLL